MIRQTIKNAAFFFGLALLAAVAIYFWFKGIDMVADYFTPVKEVYVESGNPVITGERALLLIFLSVSPIIAIVLGYFRADSTRNVWEAKQRQKREAKARKDTSVDI